MVHDSMKSNQQPQYFLFNGIKYIYYQISLPKVFERSIHISAIKRYPIFNFSLICMYCLQQILALLNTISPLLSFGLQ